MRLLVTFTRTTYGEMAEVGPEHEWKYGNGEKVHPGALPGHLLRTEWEPLEG